MKLLVFVSTISILAAASVWKGWPVDSSWPVRTESSTIPESQVPIFSKSFVFEQEAVTSVHASAITAVSNDKLLSVWYGGSREGSGDVAIFDSTKLPGDSWKEPEIIISREKVAQDTGRHIKKLGNPILLSDGKEAVWMFFVSTSIGGWSTSTINVVMSKDGGQTWGMAKRLITSPFLNLSTLVKARPFFYKDGTIGLPAYHELAGKFAELIRVSQDGAVIDKIRISHGRYTIQPSIALLNDDRLITMMRNTDSKRKIVRSFGESGGKTWTEPAYTELPNPNSAVSMAGDEDLLVLIYNDTKSDRYKLSLAVSIDGGVSWKKRYQIELSGPDEAGNDAEFSYPYLTRTSNGDFHLVYTWQRKRIAYASFNRAWLEQLP